MSVGTWQPPDTTTTDANIDPDFLRQCIALGSDQGLNRLELEIDETTRSQQALIMRLPPESWVAAVADCSSADIRQLVRFLVLAEMTFSGWEAGELSPVITLNKLLKQRGEPLTRDEVLWIKKNSRNRYLPNGPIL